MRTLVLACVFLSSCSSFPLKVLKNEPRQSIEVLVVSGNSNVEKYKTLSKIKVFQKDKNKTILTENKEELSTFTLNRQVLDVNEKGFVQLKYWVTDLSGDVDLTNMGLPPVGKSVVEAIDKNGRVLAVQGFPPETIFYLPKIALPSKEVSLGDTWDFKQTWRSLKSGWPFYIELKLTLKNWLSCGGLKCAHITYTGSMGLAEGSPLKKTASLASEIKGDFIYAPVGHQFIWALSESEESFNTEDKLIEVRSCTASYQTAPDKESQVLAPKLKRACSL